MNAATATSIPPAAMHPSMPVLPRPAARRADDDWWVELFGWKAACDTEPTDERLLHQASLLALLSVA